MGKKYTIGVDFGTESGRAVMIEVATGQELASAVYPYSNRVIDHELPLPGKTVRLEMDWALQDPQDYIRTFQNTIPEVLKKSKVSPDDVIGVGVDFTACTMMPVKKDGTPLCDLPQYRENPHSWGKLWKHHAAQPEADLINETARKMKQGWLDRYGGKVSSEWFFSKTLQILNESPEIYDAADRLLEAADWVIWQLTGVETRTSSPIRTTHNRAPSTSKRLASPSMRSSSWHTVTVLIAAPLLRGAHRAPRRRRREHR